MVDKSAILLNYLNSLSQAIFAGTEIMLKVMRLSENIKHAKRLRVPSNNDSFSKDHLFIQRTYSNTTTYSV